MCVACGIPSHVPPTPERFAALRSADTRTYLVGAGLSMMGDSIEHVISYWVMFQQFHSPALAGFAVISHWVPSLFSVYTGAWADRYDCRKIIQLAQLLFMSVSATWGVLFLTDSLQMWHAMVDRCQAVGTRLTRAPRCRTTTGLPRVLDSARTRRRVRGIGGPIAWHFSYTGYQYGSCMAGGVLRPAGSRLT